MRKRIGQLPIENENNCAELYVFLEKLWKWGYTEIWHAIRTHIVYVCFLALELVPHLEEWESSNLI